MVVDSEILSLKDILSYFAPGCPSLLRIKWMNASIKSQRAVMFGN